MRHIPASLSIATILLANQPQNIERDFLTTLSEVSEIASATKLNIDKTPSTVTVLKQDFIQKTGAKTLYDLLCYIPGIEVAMTPSGKRQIIIRGVKNSYRDKIKFLINGTEVTNNFYTNQFYYYNFPANLIKRIEFTKTPDSVRYGANAFLGVINIITLDENDENSVSLYIADISHNQITAFNSFYYSGIIFTIDAYKSYAHPKQTAPSIVQIDLQTHTAKPFRNSLAAHTLEKNSGVGIRAKKGEWTLEYRYLYYKKGNFFGISRVPPITHDKSVHLQHQFLTLSYNHFFNPLWKIDAKTGIKVYSWNGEFRAFPYDLQPTNNPNKDLVFGAYFNEREYFATSDIKYIGDIHQLQIHLDIKYAEPNKEYYLQYVPMLNNYAHLPGPVKKDISRQILGIGIEDLYNLSKRLSITVGARMDRYNSFDNKLSYKLGFVYNIDNTNTIKFLHNHAYRAPSWIELYANAAAEFNGDANLKPEEIQMSEIQYLTSFSNQDKCKFNLFYGKTGNTIDRFVDASGMRRYKNLGTYNIEGYEISYTHIWPKASLQLRFAKNFDKRNYKKSPRDNTKYLGIRKTLFNVNFDCDIGFVHSHTFFKWGSGIDTPSYIPNVNPCVSLNQVFTLQANSFEWQFGVDNLTNKKNYYFAGPSDIVGGRYMFVPIEGKIPTAGRRFFFQLRKEF